MLSNKMDILNKKSYSFNFGINWENHKSHDNKALPLHL